MRENGHLEVIHAEMEDRSVHGDMAPDTQSLFSNAAEHARNLVWVPRQRESCVFRDRCRTLSGIFRPLLAALEFQPEKTVSSDFRLLRKISID